MNASLATATARSRLANQAGRAIVTVRGVHLVSDSPPPLGGPNESANPVELLIAALATCGTFICEKAAQEMNIPLESVDVTASGDFDPRGVCGEPQDPRLQVFRIRLALKGPNPDQRDQLVNAFRTRCPVYTTLVRAASIDVEFV